jgi:hypothetical protein
VLKCIFFQLPYRGGGAVTISELKRCLVRLYPQLFVRWLMSYLCYLCLFAYNGVQQILCCEKQEIPHRQYISKIQLQNRRNRSKIDITETYIQQTSTPLTHISNRHPQFFGEVHVADLLVFCVVILCLFYILSSCCDVRYYTADIDTPNTYIQQTSTPLTHIYNRHRHL